MKSYWFRIFRSRRRRRSTVRSTSVLFKRNSIFEGLELRSMLSGDGLGDSALVADDIHSSPLDELSLTKLMASQLGQQDGAPVANPLTADSTSDPVADPLVEGIAGQVSLRFLDLDGNVITSIKAGQSFKIEVYVDDVRTTSEDDYFGFFEAHVRLNYNASLVELADGDSVVIAPFFGGLLPNIDKSTSGTVVAGGPSTSATPPGSAPQLLYTATFKALASGSANFTTEHYSEEDRPWLMYGTGTNTDPIPAEHFTFGTGALSIQSLPDVSIGDVTKNEGNAAQEFVFTVTLSSPSDSAVAVAFNTGGGNATADSDYVATSGTLTFDPGVTSQTITVIVNGDTEQEENETFQVTLSDPTGATIVNGVGIGTILNDDGNVLSLTPGTVTHSEGDEGSSSVEFTVSLSAAADVEVVVVYSTANGTAMAGSDYIATSGTLTFAPGETQKLVTVTVLGDTIDEADETFTVQLSSPENATIAAATSVVTIQDDDMPGLAITGPSSVNEDSGPYVVTVSLSSASSEQVTVAYSTADGTATASNDYNATSGTLTFAPGETVKFITVSLIGDTVKEANETFTINLSDAVNAELQGDSFTATIANDDDVPTVEVIAPSPQNEGNSGTTPFVFTVRLSSVSETPVTVAYNTANGIAQAGSDYTATSGTLTFAPGTTQLLVTVMVIGDTLVEDANETFRLDLSEPSGATLKSGGGSATAVIVNDDSAPLIGIQDASVTEGDSGTKHMIFTVTLTNPSTQNVTVQYATQDGSATANGDYISTSGTLTFAPNETQKLITVSIVGDLYDEGNEDFRVLLSNPTNATLGDGAGIGTILDEAGDNINIVPSTITGRVFIDSNGDGARSGNEKILAGVTVNLTGAATMSTTTNADGTYSFGNLQPGTYTVQVVMPNQYKAAAAVLGNAGGSLVDGGFTFTVETPGGVTANDYHFTTRGLKSAFLSMRLLRASYLADDSESVGQVSVSISTVTNPINSSNAANTSISGTGTVGATISVVASSGDSSTSPLTTTVGTNGNWSINGINVTGLPDGTVTYTVTATENGTTATKTITANKVTALPTVDITSVTNPVNSSNQDDTSISGTGTTGAMVSVVVSDGTNSTSPKVALVDSNGQWTIAGVNVSSLANGMLTYTVTITDGGGNSATDSITTVKDSLAPSLEVTSIPTLIGGNNDHNVSISGTASEGSKVTIAFAGPNGGTVPARMVDVGASGTWTIADIDLSSLADGTITFTITATDGANNTTTVTRTATKDTVTEVAISEATDPVNNANVTEVEIRGTGEYGAKVIVVISDGVNQVTTGEVTVNEQGEWLLVGIDLSSLSDGEITYTVTATDAAGNTDTAVFEAVKDTEAPDLAIESVTNPIGIGNATAVAISGTGEIGATITVKVSDGVNEITVTQTATVDDEGNWTISDIDVSNLNDGTLTFTVKATDAAGNFSESTIESLKGSLMVNALTDPITQENEADVTIGGTGQIGAAVEVVVSDGENETSVYTATIASDGTWSISGIDVSALADGVLTFTVKAIDGEDQLVLTRTAVKDTVAEGEILEATNPVNSNNQTSVSITGFAEDESTVTIRVTDGSNTTSEVAAEFAAGVWIATNIDVSGLADGTITYVVKITDSLGNVTEYEYAANKDTVAPDLAVDELAGPVGIADQHSVSISGTAEAGATITVIVTDGIASTTAYTATANAEGEWSIEGIDVSSLADGTLTFTATATDLVGNVSEAESVTVQKRTLAAGDLAEVISQVNQTTVTISGTADPAAAVSIIARNGEQSTEIVLVEVDDEGNWTAVLDVSALGDGTITFEIVASVGDDSAEATITGEKDTVADGSIVDATDPVNAENQASASISGTAQPGSIIEVTVVGGEVTIGPISVTLAEDGTWSLEEIDLSTLPDGDFTYKVQVTDALGNVTEYTREAVKDTVAPSLTIDGVTDPIEIFNVALVTISGTTEPGAMVTVVVTDGVNSTDPVTVQADESGNWSIANLNVGALADGTLTFRVTSKDAAGNENLETIEATKTTIMILSLPDAINSENESNVLISGSGQIGATVVVVVSDGENDITSNPIEIDEFGAWSMVLDVSSLNDGLLTFTATGTDGEHSVQVSDTREKSPQLTGEIVDAPENVWSGNQGEISLSGTADSDAAVEVTVVGGPSGSEVTVGPVSGTVGEDGTWSFADLDVSALPDGPIRFEVKLTRGDQERVLTHEVVKDTATLVMFNPNVSLSQVTEANVTSFPIFGTREEGASIAIAITDGTNTVNANIASGASNGWLTQVDLSSLDDGTLTITVTATDTFGNTAVATVEVEKDAIAEEGDEDLFNEGDEWLLDLE